MTGRVQQFVDNIVKSGFSYNNEYSFSFQSNGTTECENGIVARLNERGFNNIFTNENSRNYEKVDKNDSDTLRVLCEELSLPGVSSATGQARGINQGVNFKYSHTRLYNDINFSFICDKNLTPLRFFQTWYNFIYETEGGLSNNANFTTRLYYEYCLRMYIQKTETKYSKGLQTGYYALINAHPISISSIPLNSGASSITRVSVTLSYERWAFQTAPGLVDDKRAVTWSK